MNCVVTAGPTFEPLDEVRRLTNFSTGRLGTELANYLVECGHTVTLLVGQAATCAEPRLAQVVEQFATTADLEHRLESLASSSPDAVFHAAAVSDFKFGKIWTRSTNGQLIELQSGKLPTRAGELLAELIPTPKLLGRLREWFPRARLVGWKYEVEGNRDQALEQAAVQLRENHTDACVANGPAYGDGFGLATVAIAHRHFADRPALFAALERFAAKGE